MDPKENRKIVQVKEFDDKKKQRIEKYYTGLPPNFCAFGDSKYVLPSYFKECVNYVKNMEVTTDDIFIIGGPRCGTTWVTVATLFIVEKNNHVLAVEDRSKISYQMIEQYVMGHHFASEYQDRPGCTEESFKKFMTEHRAPCIHTHMPLSLLPDDLLEKSKVIHLARDPRDAAWSFYIMSTALKYTTFVGDFKTFWNLYINGEVIFTPYFQRFKEAWAQRNHRNMLFLFYEDILDDFPSTVRRIAQFLGKTLTDQHVLEMTKSLKIEEMQRDNHNLKIFNKDWRNSANVHPEAGLFFRKGKSGQWREHFDDEMRQQAKSWMTENLAGLDIEEHLPKAWKEY